MTASRPRHRLAAVTVALLSMWVLVRTPAAGAGFWGFAGGPTAAHDLSTAALDPASELTATTSCDAAVPLTANATLSWTETPSTFAEGYTVERWRGSELEATTTVTPRTTTTLTQTALSAGTLYTWKVRAFVSSWSSTEVSVTASTPGRACDDLVENPRRHTRNRPATCLTCTAMHGRSPSRALVVVAVTIALAWGGTWTARAQLVGGGLLGGNTTTTARPATTTTAAPRPTTTAPRPTTTAPPPATTTPAPAPEGGGEPESPPPGSPPAASPGPEPGGDQGPAPAGAPGDGPPPPPPAAAGAPGAPGTPGGEPLPPAGDDGEVPPPDAGAFPAHLRALMDSVERSGSNNTRALMEALAPLGRYGLTPEEAAIVGFGRFPVAGEATYSHDWWFPRFGPGWRLHQGTDIFAARGTPVRAPVDGSVRIGNGGLGGLSVYVTGADRTYYYLAHLAGIAPGLVDGATVETGDVVGYVGDSGNARGGLPHVHFEVHPGGGGPIDPKPVLDRYLSDALAAADDVVAAYAEAARSAGNGRPVLPEPAEVDAEAMDGLRSTLLWLTSVNPSAGAVQLAQAEAVRAGAQVDWSGAGAGAQDRATGQARAEAVRRAGLWLRPLVPPALAAVIP